MLQVVIQIVVVDEKIFLSTTVHSFTQNGMILHKAPEIYIKYRINYNIF